MINIFAAELLPNIKKYEVILFGMGINNAFNSGLLYEIALNFPMVKENENNLSPYGDRRKYGTIFESRVDGIIFCACYMNNGGYNWREGKDSVKYDCLESALKLACEKYKGKKICAPIIGVNGYDGYGDKDRIKSIFEKIFVKQDIDLYDYEQKDFRYEMFKESNALYKSYKNGVITKEDYDLNRKKLLWKKTHGIFSEMPEDFTYEAKNDLIRVKKTDLI